MYTNVALLLGLLAGGIGGTVAVQALLRRPGRPGHRASSVIHLGHVS
ncbi:hypothetical protein SAMN04490239_1438 [Rhodococcus koreensis]|jgi:hypothetical protein|uniref:Uncharacterized protein n=1 Tax=Rhodococcus koreensis TaxID=99653 RepID=A0A1H4LS23_9NOCA|nr:MULTISPECIES: hypothetical protein [Rhodococcus]QQZ18535.1 hypothetical protein GO592_41030 [Rhodococcus sp. 21391]SEB73417.1 hypothetical protein SAMN04490239_1438 [Rhodococcus koreensis]